MVLKSETVLSLETLQEYLKQNIESQLNDVPNLRQTLLGFRSFALFKQSLRNQEHHLQFIHKKNTPLNDEKSFEVILNKFKQRRKVRYSPSPNNNSVLQRNYKNIS